MKTKMKTAFRIVAILAFIVLVCILILAIPGAIKKVSEWTGFASSKIANTLTTTVGVGVGGMLISFGVTALAAVPIVGAVLVIVGLAILVYALWNSGWFSGSSSSIPIDDKSTLQRVA